MQSPGLYEPMSFLLCWDCISCNDVEIRLAADTFVCTSIIGIDFSAHDLHMQVMRVLTFSSSGCRV